MGSPRPGRTGRRCAGPWPALALAAVGLAWAAAARAGEPTTTDETPSEARGAGSPPVRRAPGARVVAVLPAELPEDPSAATTVVELRDYEGEAKTTADLLADTVGVQVRRFGGPGQPSEISIRGSTASQVVILLDGVRLNSAQSGTADLSTLPAELVERIEVTRGGGSVEVGGGAVGGVVNVVTKRAGAEPRTRLVGSAGSFGTWAASATHSRRTPWLDLVAGYDFFQTEGDWQFQRPVVVASGQVLQQTPTELTRVNNRSESHAGLVKVGRDLGDEGARLELADDLFYRSRGVPGLDGGPGPIGGQSLTAHERLTRNVADLRLEVPGLVGGRVDSSVRGFYRFQRQRFTDPMPRFGPPVDVDDRNHAAGARGALEAGGQTWGVSHELRLSAEGRREWLVREVDFDPRRWVVGGSVQDELRFARGRVALVPALGIDWTEGFDVEPLPRLGLVVEPLAWLRLRANGERSYRAPSFDELYFPDIGSIRGNPALAPEQAWNADAGVVLGFARLGPFEAASLEVTYFYNDIANSIVFENISQSLVVPQNTNDATAQGVEVALAFSILQHWVDLSANYTWLDTEIANTGGPIPGRPEHEVSGRLRFGPPSGLFKLVGELRVVSEIPLTRSGNQFVSKRTTLDASASLNPARLFERSARWIPEDLLVSLTATNLTDQSVRDARGFPQPGRWLTLQLEGRW